MAISDAVLFEKWIAARDADAFAEIVSRHSAMVYSTCRRVLGNLSDAEDVAQECFIELARAKKTIRPSPGLFQRLGFLRPDGEVCQVARFGRYEHGQQVSHAKHNDVADDARVV